MTEQLQSNRVCSWQGCKTKIKLDTSFESSDLGQRMGVTVGGWCDKHTKLFNKRCDVATKLLPKWNKKKLKNKFGKVIKFTYHSDLTNYLYQNDKKSLNEINKIVLKEIKTQ